MGGGTFVGEDRVLMITVASRTGTSGGRALLSGLYVNALADIYGDRLTVVRLNRSKNAGGLWFAFNSLIGYLDGVEMRTIRETIAKVRESGSAKVFVDGSNLGLMVRSLKQCCPAVEVFTFFHNVEARFFWGSFKQNRTGRSFAVSVANYIAERSTVRYSDRLICMSGRDSLMLQSLYGREATDISPIALQEASNQRCGVARQSEKFALFVGGAFYANVAGVRWFVRNVIPHINLKTVVVGNGFEALRAELEQGGGVEVVGRVDDLSTWYRSAACIVAPIFDGSGMKTKVAEAMMYGKRVIGTPEAFVGYEEVSQEAGLSVCSTAADFISALNLVEKCNRSTFVPELRVLYERKYSFAAARARLLEIMQR